MAQEELARTYSQTTGTNMLANALFRPVSSKTRTGFGFLPCPHHGHRFLPQGFFEASGFSQKQAAEVWLPTSYFFENSKARVLVRCGSTEPFGGRMPKQGSQANVKTSRRCC